MPEVSIGASGYDISGLCLRCASGRANEREQTSDEMNIDDDRSNYHVLRVLMICCLLTDIRPCLFDVILEVEDANKVELLPRAVPLQRWNPYSSETVTMVNVLL
ncbi:hypothetical protein HAX54_031337 [Datura stramonium]|uniref:Uncharacterized protein n=1 Tax=Datura stramonium TaxID=4076 RepID=A0ABS8SBZ6_DATST|nr:hypothetical protein [Datura stramonium]